jgi:hypothetical protein
VNAEPHTKGDLSHLCGEVSPATDKPGRTAALSRHHGAAARWTAVERRNKRDPRVRDSPSAYARPDPVPLRRRQPVPRLAAWSLGAGIVATVSANLAHGIGHGPVGRPGQRVARTGAGCLVRSAAAQALLDTVQLPYVAPSLGGVETLITRPATTSHAGMSPEDRELLGITADLIRVSCGIEGTQDLIADFDQALAKIQP